MVEKTCPFCDGEMRKEPNVIPTSFDPFKVLKEARPRLFALLKPRITGEAYQKGTETVDTYLELYRCVSCGFYAPFAPQEG